MVGGKGRKGGRDGRGEGTEGGKGRKGGRDGRGEGGEEREVGGGREKKQLPGVIIIFSKGLVSGNLRSIITAL